MSRLDFTFVGTTNKGLSLDPKEFADMPLPKVTEEIALLLSAIAPDVTFFHDDIVLAAEQLANDKATPTE